MNREGVSYQAFLEAYHELEAEGVKPTVTKIRGLLGQGSYSTLTKYMKDWQVDSKMHHGLERPTPDIVSAAVEDIWQKLNAEADERVNAIKAEADALVCAANERVRAAEDKAEALNVQNKEILARFQAATGQIELLKLDLKAERQNHQTLQASYAALKEKHDLLQQESAAHIYSLKSLQERELKASAERVAELIAAHASEIDRIITRQEKDRHHAIAELDRAQVEMQKRDRTINELESILQQYRLKNDYLQKDLEDVEVEHTQLRAAHQQKLDVICTLEKKHSILLDEILKNSKGNTEFVETTVNAIDSKIALMTNKLKLFIEDIKAKDLESVDR